VPDSEGRLLALLAYIRLVRIIISGTNILAYFASSSIAISHKDWLFVTGKPGIIINVRPG
jgi:hypothetical protein